MYVYQADTYCDSCGESIRDALGEIPYLADDSDHYPQWAAAEATDYPDHCASYDQCAGDAVELTDYGFALGSPLLGAERPRIGELLSKDLTEAGYAYLSEMLGEANPTAYQRALHTFWREVFSIPA